MQLTSILACRSRYRTTSRQRSGHGSMFWKSVSLAPVASRLQQALGFADLQFALAHAKTPSSPPI
jgi:hypothetical protein